MDPPPFLWDLRCPGVVTYQTFFDLSQHDLQIVPHRADIEEELRRVQAARQVLSRSPTYDEFAGVGSIRTSSPLAGPAAGTFDVQSSDSGGARSCPGGKRGKPARQQVRRCRIAHAREFVMSTSLVQVALATAVHQAVEELAPPSP